MVGHIDDEGVLVGKLLSDGCHDGVVVEDGVIVVGHDEPLLRRQVRTVVHRSPQVLARFLGIAGLVNQVRSHQMEDDQVVLLVLALQTVVLLEHAFVELVKTGIAGIELCLAQLRIVQEEATAEVIDRLIGLRQELVGDKRHVIARLAEHLGEERIVAPLARIADSMERQHILEHVARQIPRGHHIGKRHQTARLGHRQLTGCRRHLVAIELGVVFVIALANHQDDVRHTEGTAIDLYLVLHRHHRLQLVGGQTVGIETEHQSVDGEIELGARLLRQLVLHLADVVLRHQFMDGLLVWPALLPGIIHQQGDHDAQNTSDSG